MPAGNLPTSVSKFVKLVCKVVNVLFSIVNNPFIRLTLLKWGFGCLVGCFGFNGPLRQYFSLYRAVSQREGERGKKG